MVRLARVVAPGIPHHITQRGNRREPTFFYAEDYACDLELIAQFCRGEQVEIGAYLLTAARYVEFSPVRAGLVDAPSRYRWSSAAAHLRGRDDALVRVAPLLEVASTGAAC